MSFWRSQPGAEAITIFVRYTLPGGCSAHGSGLTCQWLHPRFEAPADHMQSAAARWEEERKVQLPPPVPYPPFTSADTLRRRRRLDHCCTLFAGNAWPRCMSSGQVHSCYAVAHSMALARWLHTSENSAPQLCQCCLLDIALVAGFSTVGACWQHLGHPREAGPGLGHVQHRAEPMLLCGRPCRTEAAAKSSWASACTGVKSCTFIWTLWARQGERQVDDDRHVRDNSLFGRQRRQLIRPDPPVRLRDRLFVALQQILLRRPGRGGRRLRG